MAKIKITLVKSLIGADKSQRQTVKALGLGKVNTSVEKESNGAILGMIVKVRHLLLIENL